MLSGPRAVHRRHAAGGHRRACCTTALPDFVDFDPLAPQELRADRRRAASTAIPTRRFESAQDVAMALRALLTGSTAVGTNAHDAAAHAASRSRFCRSSTPAPIRSIEYLTDGITESIINSLSQLERPARRAAQPGLPLQGAAGRSGDRRPGAQRAHDPDRPGLQQGDILNIQAELVDTRDRVAALG